MKKRALIVAAASLLIGLSIWEFWPIRTSLITLEFNKVQANQLPMIECREITDLLERKWEIIYPNLISKADSSEVLVLLLNNSRTSLYTQAENNECNSAIEVRLEISGNIPKTGPSIISPYQAGHPQRFEWEITTEDEDLQGIVWIYLLFEKNNGQLSRIPLFAVPIEMQTISILGFSPRSFRIIIAGIIILGLLIYYYFSTRRVNDII
ncbi:MAG: hypothetical protein Q7J07_06795 [Pelolinea sp.]|nr:hypothetical protein [Pelolinea sp.]